MQLMTCCRKMICSCRCLSRMCCILSLVLDASKLVKLSVGGSVLESSSSGNDGSNFISCLSLRGIDGLDSLPIW